MTPEEVLRALADPERLAVAGALAVGPATASELSRRVGLPTERVQRHLSRLSAARLVRPEPDRRTYRLVRETLRRAAQDAGPQRDPGVALGAASEDEASVLRHFIVGGRLREIPAKRSKRLIVLDRLALEFEVGVRYRERDVNEVLKRFHDDHVSLRRYLIDEGYLSRERGEYWRTGGPVPV